jgi:hypothetical protein
VTGAGAGAGAVLVVRRRTAGGGEWGDAGSLHRDRRLMPEAGVWVNGAAQPLLECAKRPQA